MEHLYAIGLGSNRRHGRHGRPQAVISAALDALAKAGLRIAAVSPTGSSIPLGPGGRRYANAAAIVSSALDPVALLLVLKHIERHLGRRPGRRWGPRVLDLDILLWSGGRLTARTLQIPHPAMAGRPFVLEPLAAIAPGWRMPGSSLTVRHLAARLRRAASVDRRAPWS